MTARLALTLLFGGILAAMLVVTVTASLNQPLWQWGGLTAEPDRWWTYATLADAYFGFLTFFCWVAYKERSWVARILWLVAILLLGNIAMASYVLIHLWRLPSNASMRDLLLRRGSSGDEPSAA